MKRETVLHVWPKEKAALRAFEASDGWAYLQRSEADDKVNTIAIPPEAVGKLAAFLTAPSPPSTAPVPSDVSCARFQCGHRNGEHVGPDGMGACDSDSDAGRGTGELCGCPGFVVPLDAPSTAEPGAPSEATADGLLDEAIALLRKYGNMEDPAVSALVAFVGAIRREGHQLAAPPAPVVSATLKCGGRPGRPGKRLHETSNGGYDATCEGCPDCAPVVSEALIERDLTYRTYARLKEWRRVAVLLLGDDAAGGPGSLLADTDELLADLRAAIAAISPPVSGAGATLPECLRPMTPEEQARFVPISKEAIAEALEKGRRDRDAAERAMHGVPLPSATTAGSGTGEGQASAPWCGSCGGSGKGELVPMPGGSYAIGACQACKGSGRAPTPGGSAP